MLRSGITLAVLLVALTPAALAQLYDIFQALQPIAHSYPSLADVPSYNVFTTKRPQTTNRHRTNARNDQRTDTVTVLDGSLNDGRRSDKQTSAPVYDGYTTPKPSRKIYKASNQRSDTNKSSNQGSKNTAREVATKPKVPKSNQPTRVQYNDATVFADGGRRDGNAVTERPNFQSSTGRVKNGRTDGRKSDTGGRCTTPAPFLGGAVTRPTAVDDVRPPITNGPPERPAQQTAAKTAAPPVQSPKDHVKDTPPELIIAPDEDSMTEVEKRRYVEISESMCDRYKDLNTRQLQAIPLVPSPEPVRINVTTCAPSTVPLVVGGKVVTIMEFPHMALIGWPKLKGGGYAWRCGGSLISDLYVLTAAHCAYEERDNSILTGTPRAVRLGSSRLDDGGAPPARVAAVVRHPKYRQPRSYYDIALVRLASRVTFSSVIRPACLGAPPPPNDFIIATGWGRTEFGGEQSRELRGVSVQVWGARECAAALGKSRRLPDGPSADSQICAGVREGGKDTCQGDSGGPAQLQDGCVWRVVAVTSLGRSCGAPNTPAVYATVQIPFVASVAYKDQAAGDSYQGNARRHSGQRDGAGGPAATERRPTAADANANGRRPSYNYNQNSGDYSNNYDIYNAQPYYNEPPTWF